MSHGNPEGTDVIASVPVSSLWSLDDDAQRCVHADVAIATTAAAGRHLVAQQPLAAGTLIVSELPLVHSVHKRHQASVCHQCFGSVDSDLSAVRKLQRCSGCRWVHFCGVTCQRTAWKRWHRVECAWLGALVRQARVPPLPLLLLHRLVLQSVPGNALTQCPATKAWTPDWKRMRAPPGLRPLCHNQGRMGAKALADMRALATYVVGHLVQQRDPGADEDAVEEAREHVLHSALTADDLTGNERRHGAAVEHGTGKGKGEADASSAAPSAPSQAEAAPSTPLPHTVGEAYPNEPTTVADALRMLVNWQCALQCNGMNVNVGSERCVAVALFGVASILNHSCDPNCIAVHRGMRVEVRTTRPVAAGQALTLPYLDTGLPLCLRRQQLQQTFHFRCMCPRCTQEEAQGEIGCPPPHLSWACAQPGCDGLVLPLMPAALAYRSRDPGVHTHWTASRVGGVDESARVGGDGGGCNAGDDDGAGGSDMAALLASQPDVARCVRCGSERELAALQSRLLGMHVVPRTTEAGASSGMQSVVRFVRIVLPLLRAQLWAQDGASRVWATLMDHFLARECGTTLDNSSGGDGDGPLVHLHSYVAMEACNSAVTACLKQQRWGLAAAIGAASFPLLDASYPAPAIMPSHQRIVVVKSLLVPGVILPDQVGQGAAQPCLVEGLSATDHVRLWRQAKAWLDQARRDLALCCGSMYTRVCDDLEGSLRVALLVSGQQ